MREIDLPPPPDGYDPIAAEPASQMLVAIHMNLVAWSEDYARIEGEIAPPAINRSGVVHGGALMTLLDAAAGYACTWCPYPGRVRRTFTVSLTTNFFAGARAGRIVTEGRRTGGGRLIAFAEAETRLGSGQLLARGAGVFRMSSASASLYGEPRSEPS